jgi:ubiquitin C-terminal hydrolase
VFLISEFYNLKCCLCNANKLSFTTTSFLVFPLERVRQHLEKVKYGNFEYVTLEDCFEQNENQEKLTGENQTFCNICHRKSDFISYNRLYNCPEILTIILNRGKDLKYDISFKFSMYINIRNYVEDKNCNTNYELIGLIAHLGENEMNGHFISYCKSPVDNNWYCYNDTQVNKCVEPENEIKSCGIPYALFYQKQKDSSPIIVLYFSYEDREEYIELNGDILFEDVIIKIYEKHNWLPQIEIRFYIQKGSQMTEIDKNKTISQNGLKNGDKIILL